jgi:NAD(P)-dependent dehydrogenase (short-subunit alcohol dehydrogenase family)
VAEIIAVREVRGTIDALEKAGAEVRYRGVDVSDRIALDGALAETRLAWGAIDGVVHGAGVLADRLIADQTDEQFLRVFRTKVGGTRCPACACFRRSPVAMAIRVRSRMRRLTKY